MKWKMASFLLGAMITVVLLIYGCSPVAGTLSPQVEPPPETASDQTPEPVAEEYVYNQINDEGNLVLDATRITFLLYQGKARISHDGGETWTATLSGQWLEPGDEIELDKDGLAVIIFPEVGMICLGGNSDFVLIESEYDANTGDFKHVSRIYDGGAILKINPLPTSNSIFSFGLITGLIQARYDEKWVRNPSSQDLIDEDNSIITGAMITNQGEVITHFRGPVELFNLAMDEEYYYAISYPLGIESNQSTTIGIPLPRTMEIEGELEEFLIIADHLITEYTSGNRIIWDGFEFGTDKRVDTGEKIYILVDSALKATTPSYWEGFDFTRIINNKANVLNGSYITTPNCFVDYGNIEIMGDENNIGCDPYTGVGCMLPENCNQDTGNNCELITGCNLITLTGCKEAPPVGCFLYTEEIGGAIVGRSSCPSPDLPMEFDPNQLGDCDQLYNQDEWEEEEFEKPDCFYQEPNWVCAETSCWVCVTPDPSMGPPPEGWDPCHPACCCEPGALTSRP